MGELQLTPLPTVSRSHSMMKDVIFVLRSSKKNVPKTQRLRQFNVMSWTSEVQKVLYFNRYLHATSYYDLKNDFITCGAGSGYSTLCESLSVPHAGINFEGWNQIVGDVSIIIGRSRRKRSARDLSISICLSPARRHLWQDLFKIGEYRCYLSGRYKGCLAYHCCCTLVTSVSINNCLVQRPNNKRMSLGIGILKWLKLRLLNVVMTVLIVNWLPLAENIKSILSGLAS